MTDKNPYDASIDWLAPQPSANMQGQGSFYTSADQQGPTQPVGYYQAQKQVPPQPAIKKAAPTKQARMPKQKALELVDALKKGAVVSSVVSFGLLALLATGHVVGTTTTTTTTKTTTPITTSTSTPSTTTSTSTPSSSSSTSSNNSSSTSSNSSSSSNSTSQGGYSFGSSSSQSSVSGTSVS